MRLIDADELKDHQFHGCYTNIHIASNTDAYMLGWNDAIDAIVECAPTVDAEPVVRCKDCRFYRFYDGTFGKGWMCFENNTARHGDDYCSRGRRKNEH